MWVRQLPKYVLMGELSLFTNPLMDEYLMLKTRGHLVQGRAAKFKGQAEIGNLADRNAYRSAAQFPIMGYYIYRS